MRKLYFALLLTGVLSLPVLSQARLTPNDLKPLEGSKWIGSLTYLDYGSGKKASIKSNLSVSRKPGSSNQWLFAYEYPDEPKANSSDELTLSADGTIFDGETVLEKNKSSGKVRFVTTTMGTDNKKPATFRYTYVFSDRELMIRKEVRVEGSNDYFERNVYSWTR